VGLHASFRRLTARTAALQIYFQQPKEICAVKTTFTKSEAEVYLDLMRIDHDVVRLVNPVEQRVCGGSGSEEERTVCSELWGHCERCENCTSLRALQKKSQAYKVEILKKRTFLVFSRYMEIDGRACVAEIVSDITDQLVLDSDQKDQISRIITNYNYLLITDPLTGVYNRRFLDEHFLPSLKCCHDPHLTVNLAFIDLDDFKHINDRYGHSAGDRLLKDAAGFWKLYFNSRTRGKEQLVVRFGGDELLIIAAGISCRTFREEIDRAYARMQKICYYSDTVQIPFSLTFGISSTEELGEDWTWDMLINRADRRMYDEKARHKSGQSPLSLHN